MHLFIPTKLISKIVVILPTLILTFVLPIFILFQPWLVKYEYKRHSLTVDPLAIYTVSALNSPTSSIVAAGLTIYSPNEKAHLLDVYHLLTNIKIFCLFTVLILSFISYRLIRTNRKLMLIHSFTHAGILALIMTVFIGGLLILAWDSLFIGFHRLFFPQGNWAFPADSILITLYPDWFWFDIFGYYLILVLLFSLALLSLYFHPRGGNFKTPRDFRFFNCDPTGDRTLVFRMRT